MKTQGSSSPQWRVVGQSFSWWQNSWAWQRCRPLTVKTTGNRHESYRTAQTRYTFTYAAPTKNTTTNNQSGGREKKQKTLHIATNVITDKH